MAPAGVCPFRKQNIARSLRIFPVRGRRFEKWRSTDADAKVHHDRCKPAYRFKIPPPDAVGAVTMGHPLASRSHKPMSCEGMCDPSYPQLIASSCPYVPLPRFRVFHGQAKRREPSSGTMEWMILLGHVPGHCNCIRPTEYTHPSLQSAIPHCALQPQFKFPNFVIQRTTALLPAGPRGRRDPRTPRCTSDALWMPDVQAAIGPKSARVPRQHRFGKMGGRVTQRCWNSDGRAPQRWERRNPPATDALHLGGNAVGMHRCRLAVYAMIPSSPPSEVRSLQTPGLSWAYRCVYCIVVNHAL
jgi:hypothetical protein